MIYQGDMYLIPITVTRQGTTVTPENIDDIKIQIGRNLKKYSDGDLTFSNGKWYFPLTQQESLKLNHTVPVQVQILSGTEVIGSAVQEVEVGDSIIKGVWNS